MRSDDLVILVSDRRVKQTCGSESDRQLMSVVDRRVGNTRVSLNTGSSSISSLREGHSCSNGSGYC